MGKRGSHAFFQKSSTANSGPQRESFSDVVAGRLYEEEFRVSARSNRVGVVARMTRRAATVPDQAATPRITSRSAMRSIAASASEAIVPTAVRHGQSWTPPGGDASARSKDQSRNRATAWSRAWNASWLRLRSGPSDANKNPRAGGAVVLGGRLTGGSGRDYSVSPTPVAAKQQRWRGGEQVTRPTLDPSLMQPWRAELSPEPRSWFQTF